MMPLKRKRVIIGIIFLFCAVLGVVAALLWYPHKSLVQVSSIKTQHPLTKDKLKMHILASNGGKGVYRRYCAACHAQNPDISIDNTPLVGDKHTWEARQKKGLATLVSHVQQGYKNMPAKGGCFKCSNANLQAAVVYMLKHSHITVSKS